MTKTAHDRSSDAQTRPVADDGVRLMVYDRTCLDVAARVAERVSASFAGRVAGRASSRLSDRVIGALRDARVGLSSAWTAGASLYRGLGRLDAAFGASSWDEALVWIAGTYRERPIAELQYWGHGRWGRVFVDRDALDASALDDGHRLHAPLMALKERLLPDARSLVWLRTCEAFGAHAGHAFAAKLADGLGARVAGHTHVIGAVQSGLHGLRPGHLPTWSASEGIAEGTAAEPKTAHGSSFLRPHTITCFEGAVPEAWIV